MKTDSFLRKHFQTAFIIHETCDKLKLSSDEARTLTYMHVKFTENDNDKEYFSKENTHDIQALEFLRYGKPFYAATQKSAMKPLESLSNRLQTLDRSLQKKYGMESRISSELSNRLRLYKDPAFREKMMKIYKENILPRLKRKCTAV